MNKDYEPPHSELEKLWAWYIDDFKSVQSRNYKKKKKIWTKEQQEDIAAFAKKIEEITKTLGT